MLWLELDEGVALVGAKGNKSALEGTRGRRRCCSPNQIRNVEGDDFKISSLPKSSTSQAESTWSDVEADVEALELIPKGSMTMQSRYLMKSALGSDLVSKSAICRSVGT